MIKKNTIINGNSLEVLKSLPDNSIDCCVTSPPTMPCVIMAVTDR